MDFLRLQRCRRFPPARSGTMETLPPFGAEAQGIRYPGRRRRMEQSAARSPPSSRTDYRLMQRAINDSGATSRISREPLEQGGPHLVLADLVPAASTLKVGESLPKT